MKKVNSIVIFLTFHGILMGQPLILHPDNPHYFLFRGKPLAIVSSGEHYEAACRKIFY